MTALYAFAKIVDDWGDSYAHESLVTQAIDWHRWIDDCSNRTIDTIDQAAIPPNILPDACHEIQPALSDTIRRFAIPPRYLHEIVEGVTFDLTRPFSIANREQLDRYCYLVASAVGLACLSIWNGNRPEVHASAIDCGRAFQLTNILRDINEDRERGRIYVPHDLLESHGVDLELWMLGQPSGNWQMALRTMVEWARVAYRSGWQVQSALDNDGQRMFSLMWHTYRRLLDRIESDLDAVWVRRVRLSRIEKATLYFQHAFTPVYRLLGKRGNLDG